MKASASITKKPVFVLNLGLSYSMFVMNVTFSNTENHNFFILWARVPVLPLIEKWQTRHFHTRSAKVLSKGDIVWKYRVGHFVHWCENWTPKHVCNLVIRHIIRTNFVLWLLEIRFFLRNWKHALILRFTHYSRTSYSYCCPFACLFFYVEYRPFCTTS